MAHNKSIGMNSINERDAAFYNNEEDTYLIGAYPSKNSVLKDKFARMSLPKLPLKNETLNYWSNRGSQQGRE